MSETNTSNNKSVYRHGSKKNRKYVGELKYFYKDAKNDFTRDPTQYYPPPPISNPLIQQSLYKGTDYDYVYNMQMPSPIHLINPRSNYVEEIRPKIESSFNSLDNDKDDEVISLLADAILNAKSSEEVEGFLDILNKKKETIKVSIRPFEKQYDELPKTQKRQRKISKNSGSKPDNPKPSKDSINLKSIRTDKELQKLVGIVGGSIVLILVIFLAIIFHQKNTIFLSDHSKAKYVKKPVITIIRPPPLSSENDPWDELKSNYNAEIHSINPKKFKTREEVIKKIAYFTESNILVTNKFTDNLIGKVDDEFIESLPEKTIAIINSDLHYNSCSINQLTSKNIQLSYSVNNELKDNSTADTIVFQILSTLRNFQIGIRNLLDSLEENIEWDRKWTTKPWPLDIKPQPFENTYRKMGNVDYGALPNGKIVGILGMDSIGKALVIRLKNFNFKKIVYFDDIQLPAAIEESLNLDFVGFDQLISESDILCLNIKTEENNDNVIGNFVSRNNKGQQIKDSKPKYYQIINNDVVSKMKDGSILINSGSNYPINLKTIKKYLNSKKLKAVAMDSVDFSDLKLVKKLLQIPNFILTPQLSTFANEIINNDDNWAIKNIKSLLENGKVMNIVPEQKSVNFEYDYFVLS